MKSAILTESILNSLDKGEFAIFVDDKLIEIRTVREKDKGITYSYIPLHDDADLHYAMRNEQLMINYKLTFENKEIKICNLLDIRTP